MSVADRSSQGNLSVLTGLESVAPLEEVDPSLAEGHTVLYDREVPFEMRAEGAGVAGGAGRELVGSMEGIKVKILTLGDEFALQQVRVELSSENDLFFHFTHALEEASYAAVQEHQKLMASFNEYPNIMIKMLNACIKDSASHLAVFIMHQDGSARLDFIQNMEYKFVELLSCHFIPSPEDIIRRHITYRYSAVKHRNHLLQQRLQVRPASIAGLSPLVRRPSSLTVQLPLQDVNALVKVKNPSLLLQLQRAPPDPRQLLPPAAQTGRR
jgi:hypothetical protein